jgi:O-antigen/teichoic acid export membrane protein
VKKFILLGVAAGLNRAGMFLLAPIFGFFISVEDFGELSLFFVLSTLLVAMLSLNFSSIVSREVYRDLRGVFYYLALSNRYHILLCVIFFVFLIFLRNIYMAYALYVILESMFLVNSTFIRYKIGDEIFLKFTLLKFIFVILGVFSYLFIVSEGVKYSNSIVFIILAVSNFPVFNFSYRTLKIKINNGFNVKYLFFALSLLPHSLSQWLNSGVDRYFVNWYFDRFTLGFYSFSYSLASIFLIVNASLSLSLPQLAVKNIKKYKSRNYFFAFSLIVTVLYLLSSSLLWLISPNIPNYDNLPIFELSFIVLSGFYMLSFYTYYSSFLFYDRKGGVISSITIITAFINILLLYILSKFFGVFGVALVTYLVYLVYSILIAICATKKFPLGLFLPVSISSFLVYYVFIYG